MRGTTAFLLAGLALTNAGALAVDPSLGAPATFDPTLIERVKLTASSPTYMAKFGYSVAISG